MKKLLICVCILSIVCALRAQYTQLDSVISQYVKKQNFNGTVLLARGGEIVYQRAVGIANRNFDIPMRADTRFKIASITKTFTAVLILQLFEQGKLDLQGTIGQYLPEYEGEAKNKVTIHHLLTYSSGIPNCEGNTGIAVYQSPITLSAFIKKYCSGNLLFEPGTQFSYNNADYILLGSIIEHITGKSFEENLSTEILIPLKMKNSGMLYSKSVLPYLANTYNIEEKSSIFYQDDPMYIENYFAAGAMYATAEDLLKFDRGIFGGNLLKKKTLEKMLTPYPSLYGVAYGFWVTDEEIAGKKMKIANRQGSIWGANANWVHEIHSNFTLIILSNTNATNLPEMANTLIYVYESKMR